jgi:very-short-patch-repair endonuclease
VTSAFQVPLHDAPELDWLMFEQSGVLSYRQATRYLPPGKVRGLVNGGRWRALVRGILLAGNGQLTRPQQLWAAVLVAGPGALLAGETAAAESGVQRLRGDPIWILVPAARHRSQRLPRLPLDMPGVVVHRTSHLPLDHVQVGRPGRTSLPRAILDAVAWARSDEEARTIIASACQQRRVTTAELRSVADALPRMVRRALAIETIGDLAGGAQTLSEIDLVKLCRRAGLPVPDLQERRRDRDGRRRYLDAYWRDWGLHVEVDGAHHMDVRHWEADLRRQNEVWIPGDRILRFSGHQVRRRSNGAVDQIRRALLAAGWKPPPPADLG